MTLLAREILPCESSLLQKLAAPSLNSATCLRLFHSHRLFQRGLTSYIPLNDLTQLLPAHVVAAILELLECILFAVQHHPIFVVQMFVVIDSSLWIAFA
jgi:hypothetical protein